MTDGYNSALSVSPSRHTLNICPYCCLTEILNAPISVHSILTIVPLYTGLCMTQVLGVTYQKIPL